jgi:hypothetical protein
VDCGVGAHHEEFFLPFQPPWSAIYILILFIPCRLIGCQLSDVAVDSRLLFVVGVAGSSADCTVDCRVLLTVVFAGS